MIIRLLKAVKKPTGKAYFKPGTELPVNKEWGIRLIMEGSAVEIDADKYNAAVKILLSKKTKHIEEEE